MDEIDKVENFIFNDEVQNLLSQINDNVMEFNILEITGMGTQEIKHSNILGWLFENSEHNLEYGILDDFLKKVIETNKDKKLEQLQNYLYLPNNSNRDIIVYREKDYIDLLIVDESNKIVITIENKVYAKESDKQLSEYKEKVDKSYSDEYDKYYIFLTINLEKPSNGNEYWLIANHQMIIDTIDNILQNKELITKSKIILESYVDLFKRRGIVADKKLEELCGKIWLNKEYADALNILMQHKTTASKIFYDSVLNNELNFKENTVFLELEGTERLYKILGLNWEEEDSTIFDVSCEYENEDIVLYFSHHKLIEQDEDIQNICYKLKRKKSKKYEEIKRYTADNLLNKGEEYILKDIKDTMENIDKEMLILLNSLN
ncbi:MAG: PD-(D/E)XK nuclease family protein [Patescibacteria group bacterium]|nr:PD-(D/E)XK nuclease family protein [Patescibacteria group bacterium]